MTKTKDKQSSPSQLAAQIFKAIIDSPVDDNGVRVYRCEWNNSFANIPPIVPSDQRAPMISTDDVTRLSMPFFARHAQKVFPLRSIV